MASNRMYLRCRACGHEFKIGTYNEPGPWDVWSAETSALTAWFANHGLMGEHEGRDHVVLDAFSGEWYELAYE